MKKHELKDYNRLLRAENEALKYILQEAEDSLSEGCRCGEIKLLQEENTELVKDINDIEYEWAKDHAAIIKQHDADCSLSDMTLKEFEQHINNLAEQSDRYRGIIRDLKKEKYDMGMELEKLKKQNKNLKMYNEDLIEDLETSRKRLRTEAQR